VPHRRNEALLGPRGDDGRAFFHQPFILAVWHDDEAVSPGLFPDGAKTLPMGASTNDNYQGLKGPPMMTKRTATLQFVEAVATVPSPLPADQSSSKSS
jgi:hypothetical protein